MASRSTKQEKKKGSGIKSRIESSGTDLQRDSESRARARGLLDDWVESKGRARLVSGVFLDYLAEKLLIVTGQGYWWPEWERVERGRFIVVSIGAGLLSS
ncbi:hypothetical protein ACFE04_029254 [Oxalis oulophora]